MWMAGTKPWVEMLAPHVRRCQAVAVKTLCFAVLLALATGCASPSFDNTTAKPRRYVLSMCLVSDEKLAKDDPTFIHKGRVIRVCCDGCVKDFQKEPEKYLKLIEAAERKQAAEKVLPPKR